VDSDLIREHFQDLSVWTQGDKRAPYKPILLLWTLARYQAGSPRLIRYAEMDPELLRLFKEFAPQRGSHTEYPFWYLQNDGVWEVVAEGSLRVRVGKASQPTKRSLVEAQATGGLLEPVFKAVMTDSDLLRAITSDLLNSHFPDSVHGDLLATIGLNLPQGPAAGARDPRFRRDVLVLYSYRCALCGFDARLYETVIGLEAAHIKWRQAGGPATTDNGLALCALHHKLFDRGAFSVSDDGRVRVSQAITGGKATKAALLRYRDRTISFPAVPEHQPSPEFLKWHRREVFTDISG
jgi:putative restriction endonuclease